MYRLTRKPRSTTDPRRILPLTLIVGQTLCLACTGTADDPPQPGSAEWELVEDLRLDANAEDFSAIGPLIIGPQREIVVPEPQDRRLRVYDSTGTLLATIGRRGEGPGEFQHLAAVFWTADTLVVFDGELARTTYLLRDGSVGRTETGRFWGPDFGAERSDSTFFGFAPQAIDDEGALLGFAYLSLKESSELVALRVPGDGTPHVVASPPQYYDERWSVTVSGLNNPVPFAFRLRIEIAPDASRFLFATADQWSLDATYDLTILRPNGDTIFARSYAYDAEPIPDSAMDRGIANMVPESGLARRFRATARQRAPVVYGPKDVTLGLDGTVWVELRSTERGTPVVVISETGDPIGSLLLPPLSKIRQASLTHVWVTERDPLDLASVVRYRVIRPD